MINKNNKTRVNDKLTFRRETDTISSKKTVRIMKRHFIIYIDENNYAELLEAYDLNDQWKPILLSNWIRSIVMLLFFPFDHNLPCCR